MITSAAQRAHLGNIQAYYSETVDDYRFWSSNYSFHFGYFKAGINPFSRTQLLEQLEVEMFNRLCLSNMNGGHIIDLGCGLGGTMRTGSKLNRNVRFSGINFMEAHVRLGNEINQQRGFDDRIRLLQGNYFQLPFSDNTVDGAYMMESFCYCQEGNRPQLFSEIYRVLKPGSRLVISDGFQNEQPAQLGRIYRNFYTDFCHAWALAGLAPHQKVVQELGETGFQLIDNEDISTPVMVSFAHIPFATLAFLFRNLIEVRSVHPQTIAHLKGSLLSFLIGINRKHFRYGLITVEKLGS